MPNHDDTRIAAGAWLTLAFTAAGFALGKGSFAEWFTPEGVIIVFWLCVGIAAVAAFMAVRSYYVHVGRSQERQAHGIADMGAALAAGGVGNVATDAIAPQASSDRRSAAPKKVYQSETITIADLLQPDDMYLDGLVFERCEIVGPAILLIMSGTKIERCQFTSAMSAVLWTLPDPAAVTGVIGLRNCTFHQCQFARIGITGPPHVLQMFLTTPT